MTQSGSPRHLSIAGKGGTGKTTLAALSIDWMCRRAKTPVLAVDADPNANLGEALGLEVQGTIASVLADSRSRRGIPEGMSVDTFVEYRLSAALTESSGVDLLTMGGPEGPGCYCYPNDLLRRFMERLADNYAYLVMDNEAGLEHLSRRVARDVDVLLVTSDPTARGVRSAGRIYSLVRELQLEVGSAYLVLQRSGSEEAERLAAEIERTGLELAGCIPSDPGLMDLDIAGEPLSNLGEESPARRAVGELLARLGI